MDAHSKLPWKIFRSEPDSKTYQIQTQQNNLIANVFNYSDAEFIVDLANIVFRENIELKKRLEELDPVIDHGLFVGFHSPLTRKNYIFPAPGHVWPWVKDEPSNFILASKYNEIQVEGADKPLIAGGLWNVWRVNERKSGRFEVIPTDKVCVDLKLIGGNHDAQSENV